MKKTLLLFLLALLSTGAFAIDLNREGEFSVSVDVLSLFQNEVTVRAEYRFAAMYSGELGVTYGFGGRAAHPDGNFIDVVPAVKSLPIPSTVTNSNWYLKLLGKARFVLLSGDTKYGVGAGFGYDGVASSFFINPEVTSEFFFTEAPTFSLRLAAGYAH